MTHHITLPSKPIDAQPVTRAQELPGTAEPEYQGGPIIYRTDMAVMGWFVTAIRNGKKYRIAVGLINPDPTISWCKKHPKQVADEMDRMDKAEATTT